MAWELRNLGQGLVGGYLQGPDTNGAKLAEITLRILSGTRPQDIGVEGAPYSSHV